MNVTISVGGTFHAFILANELQNRDSLAKIFTTYPRFKLDPGSVPQEKIAPIRYPELFFQIARAPVFETVLPKGLRLWLESQKNLRFDSAVSRRLEPVEDGLFVGFASKSLKSLRRANDLGYTTVVENSSAHVREQADLLSQEYEKYGGEFEKAHEDKMRRYEQEYEEADYIVTPSQFARQSFLDRGYPEQKVKAVPIGINMRPFQHSNNMVDNDDNGPFYFLFSGGIKLRKGPQYLLEAWDRLDLPDAELVLTNTIEKRGEFLVKEYGDRDDIHFLGWVDDLHEWFNKASVFVLPSIEDGFGMVVTEAMAAGLPVIVSENTGAKDCVGDGETGIVVPIRDPESLAEAMRTLYWDDERRAGMGEAGRNTVLSEYNHTNYGERVYRLYQSLVE